jgi:hypothetical protein
MAAREKLDKLKINPDPFTSLLNFISRIKKDDQIPGFSDVIIQFNWINKKPGGRSSLPKVKSGNI